MIEAVRCGLVSDTVRQFGEAQVRVTGSSMLPSILPGDTLVVQRQDINQFDEGDIALFSRGNRLFAHRILGKNCGATPFLVTRGDSLSESDALVLAHELLGRVTTILRGASRIAPTRPTALSRVISGLFQRSELLTTLLLWMLNRARSQREGAQCRA